MTWLWGQEGGWRGTRQGRTIELRLEGRLLCLWGQLGREVSLEVGELSLLPLTDLGPQPSDPLLVVLGPPASFCPVPVVLTVRKAWHHKVARI